MSISNNNNEPNSPLTNLPVEIWADEIIGKHLSPIDALCLGLANKQFKALFDLCWNEQAKKVGWTSEATLTPKDWVRRTVERIRTFFERRYLTDEDFEKGNLDAWPAYSVAVQLYKDSDGNQLPGVCSWMTTYPANGSFRRLPGLSVLRAQSLLNKQCRTLMVNYCIAMPFLINHPKKDRTILDDEAEEDICLAVRHGAKLNLRALGRILEASENPEKLIKRLVLSGLPINRQGESGQSALHIVAEAGQAGCVEALLKMGADPSLADNNGDLPLHAAAANGQLSVLKCFADQQFDLDTPGGNQASAVFLAAENGHQDCLRFLLDAGACPKQTDHSGNSPLMIATAQGHQACVHILCEQGVDLDAFNNMGINPSMIASMRGDRFCLAELIGANANLALVDQAGRNLLHHAAGNGHSRCVSLLLDSELEKRLGSFSSSGKTPLHQAVIGGHNATIQLLIRRNVDPNQPTAQGEPPLQLAISSQQSDALITLIELGADIHVVDNSGQSLLHKAVLKGHWTSVETLVNAGVGLDIQDGKGRTALFLAAETDQEWPLKFLIQAGAKLDIKNAEGRTAKEEAKKWDHKSCYKALQVAERKALKERVKNTIKRGIQKLNPRH